MLAVLFSDSNFFTPVFFVAFIEQRIATLGAWRFFFVLVRVTRQREPRAAPKTLAPRTTHAKTIFCRASHDYPLTLSLIDTGVLLLSDQSFS